MNQFTRLILILIAVFVIAACGSASSTDTNVSGTISYEGEATLPDDATVQVQVQDTSLADAPAKVIGEQIITNPDGFPIEFEVEYDANQIQDNLTYGISVRITDQDGKLSFINDTHIPVITRGNPTEDVEVVVISVGG